MNGPILSHLTPFPTLVEPTVHVKKDMQNRRNEAQYTSPSFQIKGRKPFISILYDKLRRKNGIP